MTANTSGGRISNAVIDGINKSINIKPKSSTLLDTNPVKGTRDLPRRYDITQLALQSMA
jgi:hypothetical protein